MDASFQETSLQEQTRRRALKEANLSVSRSTRGVSSLDTSFSALLNDASKTLARQRDKGPRVCTVPAPPRKTRMSKEKRAQVKQAFADAVFEAMETEMRPEHVDRAVERILATEEQAAGPTGGGTSQTPQVSKLKKKKKKPKTKKS